jgi:hypothetical protein
VGEFKHHPSVSLNGCEVYLGLYHPHVSDFESEKCPYVPQRSKIGHKGRVLRWV